MIHEARPRAMPIVVGAPRSGTTLLRFMLDAHPDLAMPPETGFLVPCAALAAAPAPASRDDVFRAITRYPPDAPGWQDFAIAGERFRAALTAIEPFTVADGVRAFYRLYAARFGKSRSGDKTPLYCLHLTAIEALLPEAHFIHIIRDGRDVALSLRPMWFAPGRDITTLARHWAECVTTARRQGARCRRYLEVRYEALVEEPGGVLADICAFLDLGFDDRMLQYHELTPARLQEHRARVRDDGSVVVSREQRFAQQRRTTEPPDRSRVLAWKHEMPPDEQRAFAAVAGEVLTEFGFERT